MGYTCIHVGARCFFSVAGSRWRCGRETHTTSESTEKGIRELHHKRGQLEGALQNKYGTCRVRGSAVLPINHFLKQIKYILHSTLETNNMRPPSARRSHALISKENARHFRYVPT